MRAQVTGSVVLVCYLVAAFLPGPVLQLVGPWSSCDDLGGMAPGIAAGVPSASEWPRGCDCMRGLDKDLSAANYSQAAIKPRFPGFIDSNPFVPVYCAAMTQTKLTRKQIREGLEQIPVEQLLGRTAARELTGKQKAFALEVARGSTGAAAYRASYKTKATPKTQGNQAHRLKKRPDIQAEIEAYQAAIESEKHRTPAALRALIIKSLVGVIIDEDTPPAVLVQAAKVAGTISEVGLYVDRKEVRTISSSDDAKARVMAELRRLMNAQAEDAHTIDAAASSLLDELADVRPHPSPTSPTDQAESLADEHTIPSKQSQELLTHPPSTAHPPPIEN